MNVFVEHDAATLAAMAGAPRPGCDGLIVRHGGADDVLAATLRGNPLDRREGWLIDSELPSRRMVCWSGSLSEEGLFERHPANWLKPGREALAEFCRELAPQLADAGWRLCFQPHARHVLSDPQSCLNLLREFDGGPFEAALSPATMLEPSMLKSIEDHLRRMFEGLGPRCAMVTLSDVVIDESAEEARCELAPLGQGLLPRGVVLDLLRNHVPEGTPIVIGPRSLGDQLAWLAG